LVRIEAGWVYWDFRQKKDSLYNFMKRIHFAYSICLAIFLLIFLISCHSQEKPEKTPNVLFPEEPGALFDKINNPPISEYIRNMYQDKNGNFWFGTNGYGVAHFDGDHVSYYSLEQGFGGQQITGITEDSEKNIWFSTDRGVVSFDWSSDDAGNKRFTNYTDMQYFGGEHCWSICADTKGRIWAGAVTAVYRFDGKSWEIFQLPYPENISGEFITSATSWSIIEDRAGNMWFSTNGYGAFKYDGQSFTQYTEKEGLTDNHIDVILEDSNGNMWFGTRFGGISRYDGTSFTNFTARDKIGGNEVCALFEDSDGNIWCSSEGFGVYLYDGTSFINFFKKQGLQVAAVQCIFQDTSERIWAGGGGGLYRLDGISFVHIGKNGPWK